MTKLHLYCGYCGRERSQPDHQVCGEKLQLEPPRYCSQCGRRMQVQVTPTSWTARCVEHGETVSS